MPAIRFFDNVRHAVTGTPGTGTVTPGAAAASWQTLSAAGASDGDTTPVRFDDTGDAWELSYITLSSSLTVATRTLIASSTGSLLSLTSAAVMTCVPFARHFGSQFVSSPMNIGIVAADDGANNLIIDIKTSDGADPSLANPVRLPFQDDSGLPVWRDVEAALTLTIPENVYLGMVNSGLPFRVWVRACDDGGVVRLGAQVCGAYATGYGGVLQPHRVYSLPNVANGIAPAAVTISNASPAVVSWPAHGLNVGDEVVFTTTGALPTGLTAGARYWVSATGFGANSFSVSPDWRAAAPVNTSSGGTGTHTAQAGLGNLTTAVAVASKAWVTLGYLEWDSNGLTTAGAWDDANLIKISIYKPGDKLPGDTLRSFYAQTQTGTSTTGSGTAVATLNHRFPALSAANFFRGATSGPLGRLSSGDTAALCWYRGVDSSYVQISPDTGSYDGSSGSLERQAADAKFFDWPKADAGSYLDFRPAISEFSSGTVEYPYDAGAGNTGAVSWVEEIMT